jgi:hypothetical protein
MNLNDERDREIGILAGILRDICAEMEEIELKAFGVTDIRKWKNKIADIDNVAQHVFKRRYSI